MANVKNISVYASIAWYKFGACGCNYFHTFMKYGKKTKTREHGKNKNISVYASIDWYKFSACGCNFFHTFMK